MSNDGIMWQESVDRGVNEKKKKMYVGMYIHTYAYTCIYIHTRIHIYAHNHISSLSAKPII